MPNIRIINPLDFPGYDELLLTNEASSFFHTSAWARVLAESYGYKPLYFVAIENDSLSALVPIMEIKSILTGKRGVSLPFTDYCQVIVSNQSYFQKIIQEIIDYGKSAGWKSIEFRNGKNSLPSATPSLIYYAHTLELTPNEQELFQKFRSSTRRSGGGTPSQRATSSMLRNTLVSTPRSRSHETNRASRSRARSARRPRSPGSKAAISAALRTSQRFQSDRGNRGLLPASPASHPLPNPSPAQAGEGRCFSASAP